MMSHAHGVKYQQPSSDHHVPKDKKADQEEVGIMSTVIPGETVTAELDRPEIISVEVPLEMLKVEGLTRETRVAESLDKFHKENRYFFLLWTLMCILAVGLEEGRYVVGKVRFIVFYLFWITWPLAGFVLCILFDASQYGGLMKGERSGEENMGEEVGVSIIILCFAVLPALQAYSLKYINRAMPATLENISLLGDSNLGIRTLNLLGCRTQDDNDTEEEDRCLTRSLQHTGRDIFQVKQIYPERLFHWLPLGTITLSLLFCLAFWFVGFFRLIDIETLQREWPFFALMFFYLSLPSCSTVFSLIFIRWLTHVYNSLAKACCKNAQSWDVHQVKQVSLYIDKVQEIFGQLNSGFLRYTLGMNLLVVIMSAIVCVAKVLQGFNMIIYLEPLLTTIGILVALCHGSAKLMAEYDKVREVLKTQIRARQTGFQPDKLNCQDFILLREHLQEAPPQVVIFGDHHVGYGLLVTLLGFIMSYALLVDQIIRRSTFSGPTNVTCI